MSGGTANRPAPSYAIDARGIVTWRRDGYEISTDRARIDLDVVHGYLVQSYWCANVTREHVAREAVLPRPEQRSGDAREGIDELRAAADRLDRLELSGERDEVFHLIERAARGGELARCIAPAGAPARQQLHRERRRGLAANAITAPSIRFARDESKRALVLPSSTAPHRPLDAFHGREDLGGRLSRRGRLKIQAEETAEDRAHGQEKSPQRRQPQAQEIPCG